MGRSDQGQENPFEQADRQVHRVEPSRSEEVRIEARHGTFALEGSVRRRLPPQEGRGCPWCGPQRGHQDLEPSLHDPAAVRRPHIRGLQRAEAYPRLRERGDGRSQVRRVLADPDFPRSRSRQKSEEEVMGKTATPRALSDSEAKAVARMLRVSPQKLNLVAQLIRGKKVSAALADLEFSRKRIALDVRKCLQSAIANAENNHNLDVDDLVVSQAFVGKALVMKRFHARARGRGARILKPFSNLTIVVREVRQAEAA